MRNVFDKFLRWFTGPAVEVETPRQTGERAPPERTAHDSRHSEPARAERHGAADDAAPQAPRGSPSASPAARAQEEAEAPAAVRAIVDVDAPSAGVVPEEAADAQPRAPEPIATGERKAAPAPPPEPQEIARRRELVRSLFNDYWSGRFDKPAAFVDRLNEAETYLNERLEASGEGWRLDAGTRKMLGLPPRGNSRATAGGTADR